MRNISIAWMLATCVGCGGGGGTMMTTSDGPVASVDAGSDAAVAPSNAVTGTVLGQTLNAKDGVCSSGGQTLQIIVGDSLAFCAALTGDIAPKNATMLIITIGHYGVGGAITFPAAGDYAISVLNPADNTNAGQVQFQKDDATCRADQNKSGLAMSGTVHLTAASMTGRNQGTFDLLFGTDHLTGSFDTTFCDTIGQNANCL